MLQCNKVPMCRMVPGLWTGGNPWLKIGEDRRKMAIIL